MTAEWLCVAIRRATVAAEIVEELERARKIYKGFDSLPLINRPHYAHSVIEEEFDELWDEIKAWPKRMNLPEMRKEAIQLAAMAMAFVVEICDEPQAARIALEGPIALMEKEAV